MPVEPIRYLVEFRAKKAKGKDLREFLETMLPELEMEDECIDAAVWQDNTDADTFVLVEHWMSTAAHDEFLQALDDAGAMDGLDELLTEPPATRQYLRIT